MVDVFPPAQDEHEDEAVPDVDEGEQGRLLPPGTALVPS